MAIILIDFDSTCVKHNYPKVGNDIGAVPILKELVDKGHKLILFTMRSNDIENQMLPEEHRTTEKDYLDHAIIWFSDNEIPLYGIQKNPLQHTWTTSPKAHGDLIIDDTCLGIPLKNDGDGINYVDWIEVRKLLVDKRYL